MENVFKFTEMDFIYSRFSPLTPYGKKQKEKREFFTDIKELRNQHYLTQKTINFLRQNRFRTDKIKYHLKNIPDLDFDLDKILGLDEFFLIKKFLFNSKVIIKLLAMGFAKQIKAKWELEKLYVLLKKGGGDGETFYLSDKYLPLLAKVRSKIKKTDVLLNKIKNQKFKFLKSRYGLNFGLRDFLVVDRKKSVNFSNPKDLFIEPYDDSRIIVKPVFDEKYFKAHQTKEKLIKQEKTYIADVFKKLSKEITKNRKAILNLVQIITDLDIFIAKADLALRLNLSRPKFLNFTSAIEIEKAKFLPLSEYLKKQKLKYTSLNCKIKKRVYSCTVPIWEVKR